MADKGLFNSRWYHSNYQPPAAITKCPKSLIFILAFFLFFSVGKNDVEIDGFALKRIVKDQFSVAYKPRLGQEGILGCIPLHFTFSDHALLAWRIPLLMKALRHSQDTPPGISLRTKVSCTQISTLPHASHAPTSNVTNILTGEALTCQMAQLLVTLKTIPKG